jgi:hypothetical protein
MESSNNITFGPSVAYGTNTIPASNYGWQCPGCQRCYAPSVQQCFYCGSYSYAPVTTTTEPYITYTANGTAADPSYKTPNTCHACRPGRVCDRHE